MILVHFLGGPMGEVGVASGISSKDPRPQDVALIIGPLPTRGPPANYSLRSILSFQQNSKGFKIVNLNLKINCDSNSFSKKMEF